MDKEGSEFTTIEISTSNIIKKHAYWAVAAGLIPIPLADLAAVSAIQMDMLKAISKKFNIEFSNEKGKSLVSSLLSVSATSFVARAGASAIKSIPFVGTALGLTSMPLISGASTYALGQVFTKHFENGGSFDNFNSENMKSFFKEKMEEGKAVVQKMREKYGDFGKKQKATEKELKATRKIKKLQNLLQKGMISEKEYEKKKKKIIKNLINS